jgi:hypothetical protein
MIEKSVVPVNGNVRNFHSQIITVQMRKVIVTHLNVNTQIVAAIGKRKKGHLKIFGIQKN